MGFFGYGRGASRARRSFVSLVWNLSWGFTQIVIIITLLVLSGKLTSPTQLDTTEWHACDRPLGAWACLWIVRVILACVLTWWGYKRDHQAQLAADPEAQAQSPPSTVATPLQAVHPTVAAASSGNINHPGESHTHTELPPLPYTILFKRLSLMSSLFSLSWFVTAHILEYTSVNTCRLSSPHIWWLILGILSITYLMILEVIILGFIVFIIAPIIFLVWNIFLMCIGRHPLQNPHMIKPEIGKLPKSVVDRIPLVMYIPPPPDAPPSDGPIKIPDAVYTYPPKPETTTPASPKRRFKFLKFKSKPAANSGDTEASTPEEKKSEGKEPQTWEDNWEQEGYPFVVLENNRASCAICLLDFEEPRKVGQSSEKLKDAPTPEVKEEANNENITEEERKENLRLKDAGEGPQPLRLLACGHVFHKPCLDPWLTDVSGRCPVCNRRVEIPEPTTKKRRP